METDKPFDVRLRDPLGDVTRKERRSLLAASIISITIAKSGLVPLKISALGIEFAKADQRSLLIIMSLITLYFLVAFIIYAASDFVAWRLESIDLLVRELKVRHQALIEALKAGPEGTKTTNYLESFWTQLRLFLALVKPISILRALFDFLLPIFIGIYAVVTLFCTKVPIVP